MADFLVAKGWTTWLVDLRGDNMPPISAAVIWFFVLESCSYV